MLFQYVATDNDNKTVQGSLEAPSMDAARDALKQRQLYVTDLREASRMNASHQTPAEAPTLKTTFAFEGTDPTGVIRRGTVQAESKYQAFEQLRESQNLTLSMLSPVGVTPQYSDRDLLNWQNLNKKQPLQSTAPATPSVTPSPSMIAKKTIGFTGRPQGDSVPLATKAVVSEPKLQQKGYASIVATLRLYAGWLLSWYAVFVAVGYYVHGRVLPIDVPYVEAFYLSPLILSFTIAIFIFLALTTLHRWMQGSLISGVLLGATGTLSFVVIRMNIVS